MDVLDLVKAKLGITSDARDAYLTQLIESVKADWEHHQGIKGLDYSRPDVMDLLADTVAYKYANKADIPIPRHLDFRLKSLWVKYAGKEQ